MPPNGTIAVRAAHVSTSVRRGSSRRPIGSMRAHNVMIAIGNSGDRDLMGAAAAALDSDAPAVRGAAVWALGRLCRPEEGRTLARRRAARQIDARRDRRMARRLSRLSAARKQTPPTRVAIAMHGVCPAAGGTEGRHECLVRPGGYTPVYVTPT
jgi:hypothetical protein